MGLKLQERRKLSNLEKAAIHLVFEAYPKDRLGGDTIFDLLRISHLPVAGLLDRGLYSSNHIEIGIETHGCADELDYYSALSNTDILKPGNMEYLNTFIHEATHHWQSHNNRYQDAGPYRPVPYDFSFEELRTLKFIKEDHEFEPLLPSEQPLPEGHELLKEQHASAVATWFVIKWQIEYTLDTVDRIDLTTSSAYRPVRHSVGTVDRYHEIKNWELPPKIKNWKPPGPGRWVPRQEAKRLASHFGKVIKELRDGRIFL